MLKLGKFFKSIGLMLALHSCLCPNSPMVLDFGQNQKVNAPFVEDKFSSFAPPPGQKGVVVPEVVMEELTGMLEQMSDEERHEFASFCQDAALEMEKEASSKGLSLEDYLQGQINQMCMQVPDLLSPQEKEKFAKLDSSTSRTIVSDSAGASVAGPQKPNQSQNSASGSAKVTISMGDASVDKGGGNWLKKRYYADAVRDLVREAGESLDKVISSREKLVRKCNSISSAIDGFYKEAGIVLGDNQKKPGLKAKILKAEQLKDSLIKKSMKQLRELESITKGSDENDKDLQFYKIEDALEKFYAQIESIGKELEKFGVLVDLLSDRISKITASEKDAIDCIDKIENCIKAIDKTTADGRAKDLYFDAKYEYEKINAIESHFSESGAESSNLGKISSEIERVQKSVKEAVDKLNGEVSAAYEKLKM